MYFRRITFIMFAVCLFQFALNTNVIAEEVAGHEYDGVDLNAQYQNKLLTELQVDTSDYTDIDDTDSKDIIGLLSAAGIMYGFEDNTFRPNEATTRGELAQIILNALNINAETFDSEATNGKFYDVTMKDKWYVAINAVVAKGIMNGYEDNTFRADGFVSYSDAIVILVRALGYGDYAEVNGGYPSGYFTAAVNCRLLRGVKPKDEEKLTRSDVAQMVYNCVNAPLVEMINFGETIEYSQNDDNTILSKYHHIYKDDGIVNATSITSLTDQTTGNGQIIIGSEKFNADSGKFNPFLGYKVNYYYVGNADDNSDSTIIYMSKHKSVNEISISADNFQEYNNKIITYYNENGSIQKATVDPIYEVILNGIHINVKNLEDVIDINNGVITFVSNDDNEIYEIVFINKYENIILNAVSSDGNTITFIPKYNIQNIKVDLKNGTALDIIGSDGKKINYNATVVGVFDHDGNPVTTVDLSAVSKDVVLSIFADSYTNQRGYSVPDENATYIKVVISDNRVTGCVEGISDSEKTVTIDGKEYKIAGSNFFEETDCIYKLGDTGTFYLDVSGKITAFKKAADPENQFVYGYLIKAGKGKGLADSIQTKIMEYNGDITNFDCIAGLKINDQKMTPDEALTSLGTSASMLNKSSEDGEESEESKKVDKILKKNFTISQMIKYKINAEHKVTELQTVLHWLGIPKGGDKEHLRRDALPDKYWCDADTGGRPKKGDPSTNFGYTFMPAKYFCVPSTETFNEDDYYVDRGLYSGITLEMYNIDDYLTPAIALEYIDSSSDNMKSIRTCRDFAFPVMVKKVYSTIDKYDNPVSAILAVTGIEEKVFYGEDLNTFKACKPGQLIWLYTKKTDNSVAKFDVIPYGGSVIDPDALPDVSNCNLSGSNYYMFGELYLVNGNNLVIQMGEEITGNSAGKRSIQVTGNMNTNLAFQQGGAIVYDATDSKTNPIIKVATISDFKSVYKDGAKNASKVFWIAKHGAAQQYIIYNGID